MLCALAGPNPGYNGTQMAMTESTTCLRRSLVLVFALWGGSSLAANPDSKRLFTIERSKNANIVCYDVRLTRSGKLDQEEPIEVYWIMKAEDRHRESLTWFESFFAFGAEVVGTATEAGFRMQVVSIPERQLVVRKQGGVFRAVTSIAGRLSVLRTVYVHTEPGSLVPTKGYLEMFGVDMKSGTPTYERIQHD